ncbi:ankyrin repeat domain-containing protein 26-like [Myotis daubentonii]|uniref:ankyrin repeat domain-containing protein 26-like n=1 Tax=Myotis daubentonii TaxID=98922 RepID=UPI0028739C35|nr:ankyrin repeat domain-containing protein 26-like [Myotis daubentonii]
MNNKREEDWKQKLNRPGLDWLPLNRIMSVVRHQKETYKLLSREQEMNGFVREGHSTYQLKLKELLKVAKKKLHECDNEELSFPGDSKPSPADMEIQSKKPKQKNDELTAKLQPSSSTCIRLGEEKTPLQQLAMEALLKECEELENTAKKWEQENLNLRTHMERNMVESCVAEEYKKNIEERTRRDVADKYKQINSFLQTLRGSEEISEQRINNQDAIRSSLELRNKELKSQLSRVQDSRDDRKRELEKYVQLYQKQVKGRKLLENQLTE